MYQVLADSTVQVICGNSVGSGFRFLNGELIVTNHHVITPFLQNTTSIIVMTEGGARVQAQLLGYSPTEKYDFAILKLMSKFPGSSVFLQPKKLDAFTRGTEIAFAGFPHGITDLLVQKAIISAPISNHGFYIDGSINGGNSGGPIIDISDGNVVGIVTQRRFMGGNEMDKVLKESHALQEHLVNISNGSSVHIMGVDFADFSLKMAQTIQVVNSAILQNANSGIGIGFDIRFVLDECSKLGLY